MINRLIYPEEHWLRSKNYEENLKIYLSQQNKCYSRVKNSFIIELLGEVRGKDFLDYGCGCGFFLIETAKKGAIVTGVDAEEGAINTAGFYAEKEGLKDKCTLISGEYMPELKEKYFDIILIKDVIEHVRDDETLLHRGAELLKPDGFMVLSTQNSFSLNYLIEGTWEKFIKGKKDWCGWDETHLRFYNPKSLKKKLKTAGLKPVAWRSAYIIPHKFPSFFKGKKFIRIDALSIIDKIFGKIYPFNLTGWNITVKAMKGDDLSG
jgi:2-polyprenyl-6-hydroxyphenyl methylase/3-demethylubiquinone-9 3-methyltransferase